MSDPRDVKILSYKNREDMPPVLRTWADNKLVDLCYCLATFFNYLADPRPGFIAVNLINDPASVKPVLTRDMAVYLLGDIFPCMDVLTSDTFEVYPVPEKTKKDIERLITDNVARKELLQNKNKSAAFLEFIIEPSVYQVLWIYITNSAASLALASSDIEENIKINNQLVSARRNCTKNYGFNTDLENCAFQTLLHVIITLNDWLEDDVITRSDVMTAYKIIVPKELQSDIKEVKNAQVLDIIETAFIERNLYIDPATAGLIINIMGKFSQLTGEKDSDNKERIINRFMILCNAV